MRQKHTKYYFRAVLLLVGAMFAFLIVRSMFVPHSFSQFGFYRGDAVAEQMGKPVVFGGKRSCNDCHTEVVQWHLASRHQVIQCQNCHGPLSMHIERGEFKELMPINRSPKLCLRCHRKLPSRPVDFPQIKVKEHTGFNEQDLSSGFCIQCHPPHSASPSPPVSGESDE